MFNLVVEFRLDVGTYIQYVMIAGYLPAAHILQDECYVKRSVVSVPTIISKRRYINSKSIHILNFPQYFFDNSFLKYFI